MASSDDEDVARAIALSLGKPDPGEAAAKEVVSLDSDDETKIAPVEHKDSERSSAGMGMMGLDRAQMEAERLARKRKANSPIEEERAKAPATRSIDNVPAKALLSADVKGKVSAGTIQSSVSALNGSASRPQERAFSSNNAPKYPTGKALKTWVKGQSRNGDDVTLREVLQPESLQLAVLSSFQWDVPWLFSYLRSETRTTLIMQAKDEATRSQYRSETEGTKNLRLCFPSMEGQINCMHSKLMLLSYPDYLRIVVPTANLVPYDWGEHGTMENTVWMIDLPRLSDKKRIVQEDLTFFGKELMRFLVAKGLDGRIIDSLCGFDFSGTRDVAFVHTIGGAHTGDEWRHTGHAGLATAVNHLGLASPNQPLQIDFVTSSVGSLNTDFLSTIYRACQGVDPFQEYEKRNARTPFTKPTELAADDPSYLLNSNFRIYFPTHQTVTSSIAGGAGTICFQSSYYNNPKFPRQVLRDCRSSRKGVLMHNKIIYVRPDGGGSSWAYVGSANCSESAWGGRLVKDKVTKGPKMNCRNWECGVLVKCPDGAKGESKGMGMDIFKGTVPVPMEWPGEEYKGRKPWFFLGEY